MEGKAPVRKITLPVKAQPSTTEYTEEEAPVGIVPEDEQPEPSNQPAGEIDLLGDLDLSVGPGGGGGGYNAPPSGDIDLLSGDLGGLFLGSGGGMISQQTGPIQMGTGIAGLGDLFGISSPAATNYVAPKKVLLSPNQGKGLQVTGTWSRRNGQIFLDMTFTNKALSAMSDFAIQFNQNSFGLVPAANLKVWTPLQPNQDNDTSLPVNPGGTAQRMDPLSNVQVAVKNNVGVHYFASVVPMNVFFTEDGKLERKVFLSTWKDIPPTNEFNSRVSCGIELKKAKERLEANNVFLIAERKVDIGDSSQDLLYMSLKFVNNIWVLAELKFTTGETSIQLALKTRHPDVIAGVQEAFGNILSA